MAKIGLFLVGIGRHWWSLMGCAVFTGIGLVAAITHKGNGWVIAATISAGVFMFLVAAFLAWRDENMKYEAEKAKLANPNLTLALGHTLFEYNATTNTTTLCMSGMLVNSGADSVAIGWKARYQSSNIDITVGTVNLYDAEFEWPALNGDILVMRRNEMLSARTLKMIARGDSRQGRLLFEIPGDRRAELSAGAAIVTIGCTDFTGRLCQEVFRGYPDNRLITYPDETVKREKPPELLPFMNLMLPKK